MLGRRQRLNWLARPETSASTSCSSRSRGCPTQRPQKAFGQTPRAHTIIRDRWRLTLYRGKAQNELFDLDTDPDEMVNLWDHERFQEVKASLIEQLAELEIDVINSVPFPTSEA